MEINELFTVFSSKKIAVVGDVMIDAYIRGSVNRISPEAPVPIVSLEKTENRLGGAANVALNLISLGANVTICSVIGQDEKGDELISLFEEKGIGCEGIVRSADRVTTVKTRVIGNHQQLLRIDSEQSHPISSEAESLIIEKVKTLLGDVDAIIFQDYNKGVLTPKVISRLIDLAEEKDIPTTVDPKKENFLAYKKVTLFKPNFKELKEGLGLAHLSVKNRESFLEGVTALKNALENQITFITLSENGVFINEKEENHFIPAHLRNITDVSGAGDTVISVATLCLAAGLSIHDIAYIANLAGGLVCERSGVVSIEKNQLKSELQRLRGEVLL